MACLNSVDLIATPGRRYVNIFKPTSGLQFRNWLAQCLTAVGWTVVRADRTTGINPGVGYKATSAASPWCASGNAPAEYVGRCKVWFYPIDSFSPSNEQTSFKCMNESETMVQSTSGIDLVPCILYDSTQDYTSYSYIFVGTPYDAKVFMLGVKDRVTNARSNFKTAVFFGVPQIPGFLQARGAWCQYGIDEMFYCVDASLMRTGGLYSDQVWFAGGISSTVGGEFLNNNSNAGGTIDDRVFSWYIPYGVDGGNGISQSVDSGNWVFDTGLTPPDGVGEIWPPIIVWGTDPASPTTTKRMKGFQWDSVALNKAYPGDALLRLDGKTFIVFNHNWTGAINPYRPPGALLLRVR